MILSLKKTIQFCQISKTKSSNNRLLELEKINYFLIFFFRWTHSRRPYHLSLHVVDDAPVLVVPRKCLRHRKSGQRNELRILPTDRQESHLRSKRSRPFGNSQPEGRSLFVLLRPRPGQRYHWERPDRRPCDHPVFHRSGQEGLHGRDPRRHRLPMSRFDLHRLPVGGRIRVAFDEGVAPIQEDQRTRGQLGSRSGLQYCGRAVKPVPRFVFRTIF